jgi:hypothetical protein
VGSIAALVLVEYVRFTFLATVLRVRLRRAWAGRYVAFLAYSNNPKWAPYIAEHLLPHIRDKTLVIDRSQPLWKEQHPLEVRAMTLWGWGPQYNPMLLVLEANRSPHVFRMYEVFVEALKGRPAKLEAMTQSAIQAVRSAAASANPSLERP